jgi:ribonuclease E
VVVAEQSTVPVEVVVAAPVVDAPAEAVVAEVLDAAPLVVEAPEEVVPAVAEAAANVAEVVEVEAVVAPLPVEPVAVAPVVVAEPVEAAPVAAPVVAEAAPVVADLGGLVLVTTRPASELPVVEAPVEVKGKRRREVVREVADVAPVELVQVQTARGDS